MTKRIVTLCSIVIAFSLCFAVFSVGFKVEKTDVTTANIHSFCAEKSETTTSGAISSIVGGVMNGIESYAPSGSADDTLDKLESASDKVDGAIDKIESASDKVDGVIGGLGDTLGGIGSGSSGNIGDVIGDIGSGSSGNIGDVIGDIGSGSSGGLGDAVGGIGDALGGVGDALGGVGSGMGDSLGDVLGGLGGNGSGTVVTTTAPVLTTSADIGLIIPVPAATQITTEAETESETEAQTASTDDESKATGETVDYAATVNPYTKPTATFVAGDEDESIKWLQWIFVYTGYGLGDDGITGVLDEDTVAVVKKLQKENKMTVDGNITEDVIKAAEELYYKVILGGDVSAIEVLSQATTGVNGSEGTVAVDNANGVPVILLVVILVIIWGLAIGGIVFLFILKKKKSALQNAEQAKSEEKKDASQTEAKESLSSIADLFEEAEKNKK